MEDSFQEGPEISEQVALRVQPHGKYCWWCQANLGEFKAEATHSTREIAIARVLRKLAFYIEDSVR